MKPQNHQPTGVAGTAFVPCVAPAFPPVSPLVCRSMMPMKMKQTHQTKISWDLPRTPTQSIHNMIFQVVDFLLGTLTNKTFQMMSGT